MIWGPSFCVFGRHLLMREWSPCGKESMSLGNIKNCVEKPFALQNYEFKVFCWKTWKNNFAEVQEGIDWFCNDRFSNPCAKKPENLVFFKNYEGKLVWLHITLCLGRRNKSKSSFAVESYNVCGIQRHWEPCGILRLVLTALSLITQWFKNHIWHEIY